ncbi:MAG TPA: NAD(P)H-dependent oxidoreductase subunit E [Polyangiales bacterium]|jgi:NADH-quinone oxidoreductase subunit E|nr:NAD(P)H-dependent oxidoreductase subunit E [Polyangiales bacterium]
MTFTLSAESEKIVDELLTRYPTKRASCLPVLHLCQRELGWVSPEVIDYVAKRLELPTSEVQGVVTFYTLYHQQPVAPNVVWVCRTLSCDLRGGREIQKHLEKKFDCHVGGTSKDGKFTLKTAECLAACGQAPMVQINDEFYENLTLASLDRVIDEIAAKTSTKTPSVAAQSIRPAKKTLVGIGES